MNTKLTSAILLVVACGMLFLSYAFLYSPLMEARERLQARITTITP